MFPVANNFRAVNVSSQYRSSPFWPCAFFHTALLLFLFCGHSRSGQDHKNGRQEPAWGRWLNLVVTWPVWHSMQHLSRHLLWSVSVVLNDMCKDACRWHAGSFMKIWPIFVKLNFTHRESRNWNKLGGANTVYYRAHWTRHRAQSQVVGTPTCFWLISLFLSYNYLYYRHAIKMYIRYKDMEIENIYYYLLFP